MRTGIVVAAMILASLIASSPLPAMQAERKVERIGRDVTPPRPIEKQEPKYTDDARESRIEGSVTLEFIIEADGKIQEAKVTRGLHPGLDANAIEAVRGWRFEPAKKAGQPVAVSAQIEVNFRLR